MRLMKAKVENNRGKRLQAKKGTNCQCQLFLLCKLECLYEMYCLYYYCSKNCYKMFSLPSKLQYLFNQYLADLTHGEMGELMKKIY